MEDKEKLRKIIGDTRKKKNIARDKVSELLNIKSIERQSLSNYPDIQKAFSQQKQKMKEDAKKNQYQMSRWIIC